METGGKGKFPPVFLIFTKFFRKGFSISYSHRPFQFLGLESDYEQSQVVILPVGYDSTTSYLSGTREGPYAILEASHMLEKYDARLQKNTSEIGIVTLPPLLSDSSGPKAMIDRVQKVVEEFLEEEKFVVLLGGEHSLSVGSVKSYVKKYPSMGVLQIDAHADLRESYEESEFNHACAMRRIVDFCPVVGVAIRCAEKEELDFLAESPDRATAFFAWDLPKSPDWKHKVLERLPAEVYISIDMDGLDPSIMPSVGTPEPGGLSWEDLLDLLTLVAKHRKIIGFDAMELCPIPGFFAPNYLTAKLIYHLLGLSLR